MNDVEKAIEKIENAKTNVPKGRQDEEWMDGFNHGLDWAIRILQKDKSAY
jgi:hypothetical protein